MRNLASMECVPCKGGVPPLGHYAIQGYLADLGTGGFYWVAKGLETNGPDVSRADGDYGTRFLATAGVFNLLAALHAYEVARGRKV